MSLLIVVGVLVVIALAVAFFVWRRFEDSDDSYSLESISTPSLVYTCDPETCEHEWEVERTEDVEMTIGNSSYGGPDPMGIVTYTYYYCPKCGARNVEESSPFPL